jgi:hypothetical protein
MIHFEEDGDAEDCEHHFKIEDCEHHLKTND